MTLDQYIDTINRRYKLGNATEHTFRGDLQQLIESLVPEVRATNEPKRQSCGAPDYILTKNKIDVGYIEAKDIGDKDLDGGKKSVHKEQFDRYKASLNNLIFTDYIHFHLYREGIFITKIAIAEITDKGIKPLPANFAGFENLIKDFCSHVGLTIKSSKKLAEMMAGKARLLSDIIGKAVLTDGVNKKNDDDADNEDNSLTAHFEAFKKHLIHDITPQGFADVYAQTIAYGMFAARLHDPDLETFSRQEAAELIPKTNPFLRKLFGYIAGPDIDDRIKWVVDSLSEIFLACNVDEILKNYGKTTKMDDPVIHFYETFLSEYDPKLRKARGVWYTPAPVVNFIVRAVDDILKTEFDLPQGLADTGKITIKLNNQNRDKRTVSGYKQREEKVHKVQILDPATGTGTFLAEVVKHIHKKFENQQGIWSNYVETHLLPRLNGFELLMASYAMAHLKLDLLLKDTGYTPKKNRRFRIFLTNSLEEHHPDTGTLFANWLSSEANEANHIKRDTPVMCVIGNPPYSGESANKGKWIMDLMEDYKTEPGGVEKLKEKNPKWINDDYVKFLRYGQYFIEKNGSGVLAFINPHGFLDNPTFRGMRWNLLKTYDKIYTIDLHGNSKKKETAPDGSADVNVFDIMQGVSINIFVKTGKKKTNELGKVYHFDLFGKRDFKYDFLNKNSLKTILYKELPNIAPNYFMVQKNFEAQKKYDKGFLMPDLFSLNSVGIVTARDNFTIHTSKEDVRKTIETFLALDDETARAKFNLGKDVRDWQVNFAKKDLETNYPDSGVITNVSYRPFDLRWTFYTGNSKGFHCYPRAEVMQHFLNEENVGLVFKLGNAEENSASAMVSRNIIDFRSWSRPGMQGGDYIAPLYIYQQTNSQQNIEQNTERIPNLNPEIVKRIAKKLGLTFVHEKFPSGGGVSVGRGGSGGNTGRVGNLDSNSNRENNSNAGSVGNVGIGGNAGSVSKGGSGGSVSNGSVSKVDSNGSGGHIQDQAGRDYKNYLKLPYNYKLKARAKELRQAGNLSEVLLWKQVKNKQFKGYDFDRQKIIGDYIVDFYCSNCNVVIEIDGRSHDDKQDYDAERDVFLRSLGLEVIHIPVDEIMKNFEGVIRMLLNHPALSGTPPPEGNLDTMSGSQPEEGNLDALSGNQPEEGNFAPIDLLDYIYAVLHSPTYREKYKEFLKIDFPRVPYPKNKDTFWQLVKLGGEVRQLHLLESPTVENYITQYPIDGDNTVIKPYFCNTPPEENIEKVEAVGKVYINECQYFDNVPQTAWEFYIGGYQPAQKWLKDRKDRALEFDDILHYQKIIVALSETDRLMKEIDKIRID